jgi:hypothetical protein
VEPAAIPALPRSAAADTANLAKTDCAIEETTMLSAHRSRNRDGPGRRPQTPTAAQDEPCPGSADLVKRRQLEKAVSWTGRERLRCLWYRLRLTVAEMNYATRRIVELQAPWISDESDESDEMVPPSNRQKE